MAMTRRSDRGLVSLSLLFFFIGIVTAATGGRVAADTAGTPDTNTKAAIAPTTPNLATPGPITGAVEGTTLNIHVDGSAGKFFGVNAARLCRSGLTITTSSQMSPTTFGNCIAQPFVQGTDDDFVQASAAPTNTSVDFQFRVGSGTESSHPGPGTAITCDSTHACALWLWESVDASVSANGNLFKHFDVQYAGSGTTTTSSTTTSTSQPSTTTSSSTTTTSQPSTTTTTTSSTTTTTKPVTTSSTSTTTTTTKPVTTTSTSTTTTTTQPDTTTTSPPTTDTMVVASTATAGGTVDIDSTGWAPGADVVVVLHSDPVTLGTFRAGPNGTVSAQVVIPASIEPGAHTLELTGAAAAGGLRTLTASLTISVPVTTTTGAPLARTGADSGRMVASAGCFLLAGGLLVTSAKRRAASVS